jgi:hypothetical protein
MTGVTGDPVRPDRALWRAAPGGGAQVPAVEETPKLETEPVRPVLRQLAVIEHRDGRMRPHGGEEKADRWEKNEPP